MEDLKCRNYYHRPIRDRMRDPVMLGAGLPSDTADGRFPELTTPE